MSEVTGTKHDGDKPRMDLLDTLALQGLADVLTFGAKKYASHNWRNGITYSRLIAASFRHLAAVNNGEDIDPESGLLHIDHLACCAMFLSNYMHAGRKELDDRWKGPGTRDKFVSEFLHGEEENITNSLDNVEQQRYDILSGGVIQQDKISPTVPEYIKQKIQEDTLKTSGVREALNEKLSEQLQEDSHGHMAPISEQQIFLNFVHQQALENANKRAKEVIQAEHDKLFPSIKLK